MFMQKKSVAFYSLKKKVCSFKKKSSFVISYKIKTFYFFSFIRFVLVIFEIIKFYQQIRLLQLLQNIVKPCFNIILKFFWCNNLHYFGLKKRVGCFFEVSFMPMSLQFLPTKIKKFTLLKSVHVNKKARNQFEIRTFKHNLTFFPRSFSEYFFLSSLHFCFLKENFPLNLELKIRSVEYRFI